MKKISVLFMSLVVFAISANAQEDRAYSQGSSTVSVGYGLGNIWKSLFSLNSMFSDGAYKTTSTGPFALQYEYGATENISVGVQLGYSKVGGNYTGTEPEDNYTESLTNIGAIVRGNYHFGQSSKFDPYIGVGVGYYNFKYEYKSQNSTSNDMFSVPGAFGYSAQLGAKYYFAPTFGAYAEIGYVGGSIAQVGLTVKF